LVKILVYIAGRFLEVTMKHVVKSYRRAKSACRPGPYRPRIEVLEDRLPPGDTALGAYLASSWTAPSRQVPGARPLLSQTNPTQTLVGEPSPRQFQVTSSRLTENQHVATEPRSADEKLALFDLEDFLPWDDGIQAPRRLMKSAA